MTSHTDPKPGGGAPTSESLPLWKPLELPGSEGWRAGFTTRRAGGDLGAILPLLGWAGLPIHRLRQVHGARVLPVGAADVAGGPLPEADGLVTHRRGIVLAVASADCVPIVLFDLGKEAGAVLHAGWRGTRSRIAQEGVGALCRRFGSRPGEITAWMGPAIGACCYRVGKEVEQAFRTSGQDLEGLWREVDNGGFLDLSGVNRRQLVDAGLDPRRIQAAGLCTHCLPDQFPSYRREGPGAGRILTFLGSDPPS